MSSFSCQTCGFELWHPIVVDELVAVGLYDDDRFPGRALVVVVDHHEHLDELPHETAVAMMETASTVGGVLRRAGAERINYAILGNVVRHLHTHVIPRRVDDGAFGRTPWHHERGPGRLPDEQREAQIDLIRVGLKGRA